MIVDTIDFGPARTPAALFPNRFAIRRAAVSTFHVEDYKARDSPRDVPAASLPGFSGLSPRATEITVCPE